MVASTSTPEQQGLLDRIVGGGTRSKRFLTRAGAAYGRLFALASATAEARLRDEVEKAREAIRAANGFLRKAVMALPEALRSRFRQDIAEEDARLREARLNVDAIAARRREAGRDSGELE